MYSTALRYLWLVPHTCFLRNPAVVSVLF